MTLQSLLKWNVKQQPFPCLQKKLRALFLNLNLAGDVDGQSIILRLIWNFSQCPNSGPCLIYCLKD